MTETKPSRPGSTEVWITGIGLATSLGEGLDANWEALNARRINVDEKGFAPYVVHPLAPVNFDTQIPKRRQRQMKPGSASGPVRRAGAGAAV
jgi:3-oxoacyl-[acyl-carrier-protein] synthase II